MDSDLEHRVSTLPCDVPKCFSDPFELDKALDVSPNSSLAAEGKTIFLVKN